uniref:Uncharacterized protein n=1 Tax=Sphaerodactylus townsendi TaxID=933632 RepID=A0ACB8E8U6_9SAUR
MPFSSNHISVMRTTAVKITGMQFCTSSISGESDSGILMPRPDYVESFEYNPQGMSEHIKDSTTIDGPHQAPEEIQSDSEVIGGM